MANPFSSELNFGPLINALQFNKQHELQRNKLAMEEERLGFERDRHPLSMEHLRLGNTGLREEQAHARDTRPLDLRQKTTTVVSGEETLNETRKLRSELQGGAAATPQASKAVPTGGAITRSEAAKRSADFVRSQVLNVEDPQEAKARFEQFTKNPSTASRWQDYVSQFGSTGDWRWDAINFVRDMEHEGNGVALSPLRAAAAAGAAGLSGAGGYVPNRVGEAQPQAPQQSSAAPQAPSGPQPLGNLAVRYQMAQRKIASGVPQFVSAGEQELKLIQSEMEKGQQLTREGDVMPIGGAAETQARAAGLKTQTEKIAEGQAAAQINLPTALNAGHQMVRNIDALLADKGLDQVTGSIMGSPWMPTIRQSSANTEARIKQVQGAVFMQAYQSLKGGGAITDAEGSKAAAAIARLNDQKIDGPAYRAALVEAKVDILDLMSLAQAKANGQGAQEAVRIGILQEARAAVVGGKAAGPIAEFLKQHGIDPARLHLEQAKK